jgi:hypothetical protein
MMRHSEELLQKNESLITKFYIYFENGIQKRKTAK